MEEVTDLMEKMTPRSKDAFVNARIKEKQEQENKSSESTLSFSSALGGKPVTVSPSTGARKRLLYEKKPVPKETFENIASATDISNRKAKIAAAEFRKSEGRHSIESGFAEDISEIPKIIIKKYFKNVYIPLQVINNKKTEMKTKKITYCHDLEGYIRHIKLERGITEETEVQQKIGIGK